MSTGIVPPPYESGDSGDKGGGTTQGRDFTDVAAADLVPAPPPNRGQEPGTERPRGR
jgi:hypothetical protein